MNTKTMEGIVGARTNVNLMNTPMQVFKEAERRGDTATMERAIGYAGECADKTEEYKAKADKGMEEDARETREKAKLECDKAIQKRKEEREDLEKRIDENRSMDTNTDVVKISEEGKVLLKGDVDLDNTGSDEKKVDTAREPMTYTKTGEVTYTEESASISVSV